MNTTLPAVSGQRYSALALLAWPIVLGLLSQNIFNIVDMMMVGRLGETALGAVGLANYNNFMAAAALMGLSSGVQGPLKHLKVENSGHVLVQTQPPTS